MQRCLHQSCGMPRCLLLASKPMSYRGVYYFSAEALRPEVSMTVLKDAEVVSITEAGLLKSHKRRRSGISKCTLSEALYMLAH